MNIIDLLNNVAKRVSANVFGVNWGGCCVFASLVAERLQHLMPDMQIVVIDHDGWVLDLDKVRPQIEHNDPFTWRDNGVFFNHIIQFVLDGKKYHYDSKGVQTAGNSGYYDILLGSLTVAEATELAETPTGWNPAFDRHQIPEMRRIINEAFDVAFWAK